MVSFRCCHVINASVAMCTRSPLIGPTYLSLSNHHQSSTVRIQMSEIFLVYFCCRFYVDAATAWINDSPVFCFFSHLLLFIQTDISSPFLSHQPFSPPFYFVDFVFFWRQQVGIDQGDIPDLSQVSVHLTFHFLFLSFYDLAPLLPSLHLFRLSFNTLWFLRSICASIHRLVPYFTPTFTCVTLLPHPSLRHSSPTHFYFKQPSRLTWSESRQLPLWFDWFPAFVFHF